jgi:malate permease and related proteins
MIFHALEGMLSILIMVALGYVLTMKGWFPEENSKLIPKLVNNISLPSLMLWNLTSAFDKESLLSLLYGLPVPFLSMFLCCLLGFVIAKLLRIAPNRQGVFCTTFFCSNVVFIGLPVNLALFGDDGTPYLMLYFLANVFFCWTIGNFLISKDGQQSDIKLLSIASIKNVFSPPLIGFAAAIVIILLGLQLPDFVSNTAKYLGGMTTPLSLMYIGIIMFGVKWENVSINKDVIAILLGRFIISPLLVLLVAAFFPIPKLMEKVFVIQAAMPSMMLTAILAKVYDADTEYATLLTAITTVAAAIVIPIYMIIM